MKKNIAIFLTVCVLLFIAGIMMTVSAAGNTTILKGTPAVDGVKDEMYAKSSTLELGPTFYKTGDADGNAAATLWTLYDDKYVYIYVEVKDDDIMAADPAFLKDNADPWESECVEIRVDESGAGDNKGKFSLEYSGARFFYQVDQTAIDPEKVVYKARKIDGGYTIEMAIEMPAANAPKEGGKVGISLQVNDYHADGSTSCMGSQSPGDFIFTYGPAAVAATTETPTTTTDTADTTAALVNTTTVAAVISAPVTMISAPVTGDNSIIFILAVMALAAGVFEFTKRDIIKVKVK